MSDTTLIILVLLVAAFAVMFLLKRKQHELPDAEPMTRAPYDQTPSAPYASQAASSPAPSAPYANQEPSAPDTDQQILDQLRAAGSDLSKPHPMEFYLYFPTEDVAARVADEIEADGYRVEVKRAPRGPAWMCYVTRRMTPKKSEIAAMGRRFRELAEKYGGEYDGWETEVVR